MHCRHIILPALAAAMFLAGPAPAQAPDRTEPTPPELRGIEITEHLGDRLPLDAEFTDHNGNTVKLGESFNHDRPVVLSLIYFNCPQLCSLVLNGMVAALQDVNLEPGTDYDLVTVSFDATETHQLAAQKRRAYLAEFGREGDEEGWAFLTGDQEHVDRLTDAVGFGYRWVESEGQFAHQAAIYIITPDGRISRYLYGVMFDPDTLRLSLVEASGGEIGSTIDRFVLTCYVYDPSTGSYAASAMSLMRWGGGASIVLVALVVVAFTLIGRARRARRTSR